MSLFHRCRTLSKPLDILVVFSHMICVKTLILLYLRSVFCQCGANMLLTVLILNLALCSTADASADTAFLPKQYLENLVGKLELRLSEMEIRMQDEKDQKEKVELRLEEMDRRMRFEEEKMKKKRRNWKQEIKRSQQGWRSWKTNWRHLSLTSQFFSSLSIGSLPSHLTVL